MIESASSLVPGSGEVVAPEVPLPIAARSPLPEPATEPFAEKLRALAPRELWIERITSADALAALEPQWQALADDALEPNPFYEPWVVLPALAHLERRPVEFVLIWVAHPSGRRGERLLCGFFPLAEQPVPGAPVTVRTGWKHDYCYLGAPLVRAGAARQTMAAFFDAIARGELGRGIFRFDDLPGDGLLRRLFVDELWFRRWPNFLGDASCRAYFRPARDAETYLRQSLSARRRKEYRRLLARLGETVGPVRITELSDAADATRWAEQFAQMEAQGWKGREAVSVRSREGHFAFFQELVRHAALRDRLMMLALEAGPHVVAMKLNLIGNGGGFAFKITYDEAYGRFSPGVLLELENIAQLHARTDVRWMDSCASPNRFMINQLWPDRREFQSLLFTPDLALPSLVLALLPLQRWFKRAIARWRADAAGATTAAARGGTEDD
ncbi:MAG: GNAT family N-acetyltransferase [Myxococcaceae bacterium]|nr:GNAT family N-acetyltransferase [Myxococcaceae bacterium]